MGNCIIDTEREASPFQEGRCYFGTRGAIVCESCGESLPMPFGALAFVTSVICGFEKAHQSCRREAE